jgi:bifunctional enzyme CysN/CysC
VTRHRRSPDVVRHLTPVSREQRERALGYAGATLWLTGLPASGKSVLAGELERRLVERGRPAYVLDGDNVRHGLSGDLGFDRAAREENVRRVAHVAAMLADAGIVVLVSVVSPFAADRDFARSVHEREGLPFFEVFIDTPLEECERRDPKGLYARARAGVVRGFTGVDAPYEPPHAPELTVRTLDEPLEQAAERLIAELP